MLEAEKKQAHRDKACVQAESQIASNLISLWLRTLFMDYENHTSDTPLLDKCQVLERHLRHHSLVENEKKIAVAYKRKLKK